MSHLVKDVEEHLSSIPDANMSKRVRLRELREMVLKGVAARSGRPAQGT
jgi:hypothetical protein